MQVPTFPDLDTSSDDGSVDDTKVVVTGSTTATTTIKPGGEDNDPVQPMRSVSPAPPPSTSKVTGSNLSNSSNTNNQKPSSHRKMSQKTRMFNNPLDAFDKSPEKNDKKTLDNSSSDATATTTTANAANKYGYEDAAPSRRARSPPPPSTSSGAAKAMRRGVPAAAAYGLSGSSSSPSSNSSSPHSLLNRRMPNRSNLKKSSSFNGGTKKSVLAAAAAASGNTGTNTNDPNAPTSGGRAANEPMRGVTRRASMGSTHTTTIEVRVRGERFPVQRRRSINFDQRVEIKEVEPVSNMVGHCSEIWLQEEDFAKMKQDRRNLVHQLKKQQAAAAAANNNAIINNNNNNNNNNASSASATALQSSSNPITQELASSMRGLEKYIDKSIRAAKNLAWDTVLLEQDEQELSGDYNEERIADLYRHFTRESPDKALARAKQDEQEIQEYLWSPRTTKLMLRRLPPMIPPAAATVDGTAAESM